MSRQRLQQHLRHVNPESSLSLLHGPTQPALLDLHLGSLLDLQAQRFDSKAALVSRAQRVRHSFVFLRDRSRQIARGLLGLGVRHGDCVGVWAGNCAEYAELLFACGRIGAIMVVLNVTYTSDELQQALLASGECIRTFPLILAYGLARVQVIVHNNNNRTSKL
jgi:long-chain acyl-CoA synthetase